MLDPLIEFRYLAKQCRDLVEHSSVPEVRARNLQLAEMLEQMVAEIESGEALLRALDEVVQSLPGQIRRQS